MPNEAVAKSLSLDIETKGSQSIVHCHGRLVSDTGNILYTAVRELIGENHCIVLDLTDVKFVDSMGLGTLVRIYVSSKSAGASLQLVNLGKQLRELLGITNLFSVFADMCEHGITPRF